jgi:hypothetical protein
MEMIVLKQNSPEWEFAWNWLSEHPLNKNLDEPSIAMNNEEAWQYMGSYRHDGKVLHEFRHRNHPTTNEITFLKMNASEKMNAEDIDKIVPIK